MSAFSSSRYRAVLDYAGLGLILALLVAVFGTATEHFLTLTTFRTLANQIPDAVLVATGMTFVLVTGGIDLSVGSVLALSGAVLGVCLTSGGLPLGWAIAACLGVGLACGLLNGLLVTRWRLPSFIVTLGMMEAARGAAYLVTQSKMQYIGAPIGRVSEAAILGFSVPFLLAIVVVMGSQLTLSYTAFGRHLLAVGANEESARLAGIGVQRLKVCVFVLSGGLCSLAAVIHCARLSTADPNGGAGYELQAIAAAVIGGTSLMGGRGSAINTFIGVLIIAVLETGLVQIGAQEPIKRIVTGGVIVAAVVADYYRHRIPRKGNP